MTPTLAAALNELGVLPRATLYAIIAAALAAQVEKRK